MSMKHPRTIPSLADVSKDISGPLPVGLLDEWAAGPRTADAASALLAPYRREGFAISSDTAGLTKMTQERDLLDVLWLVSEPKQIIHAVGTAIGGESIGVWSADNTEMFYPESVGADAVVDAMVEAQARIAERASVKVGICIHAGVFYEVGGGLYGSDAQAVELLAETYARGGEILVTQEAVARLRAPSSVSLIRRTDLAEIHDRGVFSLTCARRLAALCEVDSIHPHPFPPEFFDLLRQRKCGSGGASIAPTLLGVHGVRQRDCYVVFLARRASDASEGDLAHLLDGLLENERMSEVVNATIDVPTNLAQTGGGISILVVERGADALAAARTLRDRFEQERVRVAIGIDRGPVLTFLAGPHCAGGIAGDPINLSSKISEDLGEPGRIRITERAAQGIDGLQGTTPFANVISGVEVRGVIA
jgi:hypothetical protein